MDFFSIQETFKNMFPDKLKTYTFDDNCIRKMETIWTEGKPNIGHHVEYDKVKVSVEGFPDQYVKVGEHREGITWAEHQKFVNSKNEVYMHPDHIKNLKDLKDKNEPNYQEALNDFMKWSAMTKEQIEAKLV